LKLVGKLIDQTENLCRGQILRCKGKLPYEDIVDFMTIEDISDGQREGHILLVASGYKAGLIFARLPEESFPDGESSGISIDWLKNNWYKWGYFECPLDGVYLFDNQPPSSWPE
jgi:hypothetical protein